MDKGKDFFYVRLYLHMIIWCTRSKWIWEAFCSSFDASGQSNVRKEQGEAEDGDFEKDIISSPVWRMVRTSGRVVPSTYLMNVSTAWSYRRQARFALNDNFHM